MPITLEQAKNLSYGDILHHDTATNADGTPCRLVVKGKVKTWQRDPKRIRIPWKRGLYECGALVNGTSEGSSCDIDISEVSL